MVDSSMDEGADARRPATVIKEILRCTSGATIERSMTPGNAAVCSGKKHTAETG